jgi:type IV secretory pathway VirB2 component (pilin)
MKLLNIQIRCHYEAQANSPSYEEVLDQILTVLTNPAAGGPKLKVAIVLHDFGKSRKEICLVQV